MGNNLTLNDLKVTLSFVNDYYQRDMKDLALSILDYVASEMTGLAQKIAETVLNTGRISDKQAWVIAKHVTDSEEHTEQVNRMVNPSYNTVEEEEVEDLTDEELERLEKVGRAAKAKAKSENQENKNTSSNTNNQNRSNEMEMLTTTYRNYTHFKYAVRKLCNLEPGNKRLAKIKEGSRRMTNDVLKADHDYVVELLDKHNIQYSRKADVAHRIVLTDYKMP